MGVKLAAGREPQARPEERFRQAGQIWFIHYTRVDAVMAVISLTWCLHQ